MGFSDKLRELRKNEGLSQEQLAEKMCVSRQAITKWETGKGLPDVENMLVIAEIFKITLDELLIDTVKIQKEKTVYTSETIYDIDCTKHFDISIGSAAWMILSSGMDEKLHIRLSSEILEDIDTIFKIRLDEKKNRLDVNCLKKNKLSIYEAEDSLTVEICMPLEYSDHCEIAASVKNLVIKDLHLRRLEYDGDAEQVSISGSSGSMEFTGKTDYDITIDKITGRLDVNQWKAKSVVHIAEENLVSVVNKGRKCDVVYVKDGNRIEFENIASGQDELSISGISSELVVELSENITVNNR